MLVKQVIKSNASLSWFCWFSREFCPYRGPHMVILLFIYGKRRIEHTYFFSSIDYTEATMEKIVDSGIGIPDEGIWSDPVEEVITFNYSSLLYNLPVTYFKFLFHKNNKKHQFLISPSDHQLGKKKEGGGRGHVGMVQ